MARNTLIVLVLSLFALVQLGESLKCYRCESTHGGVCDSPLKNPEIKECPKDPDYACLVKNTTLLVGGGQVVRDCAPKRECIEPRGAHTNETCSLCNEDLCNASSTVFPSLLTIAVASVAITAVISKFNF